MRRDLSPAFRDPELTVYFLHHAGGSAAGYRPFLHSMPSRWATRLLELPGRGASTAAHPCQTTEEAVAALAPQLTAAAPGRYAVFGHSMGALVAYELVRFLEGQGMPGAWLGLSGCPAPSAGAQQRQERRDLASTEELIAFLRTLGGTPAEILDTPEFLAYVLPFLRADLAIVDTYRYLDGPPLKTPASVYSGCGDPLLPPATVAAWRDHLGHQLGHRTWPGGHFYLFDDPADVGNRIAEDISTALRLRAARKK